MDAERIVAYLQAQIEESQKRNPGPYHKGFQSGLKLAIRTIETGEVSIWSAGSDEFYDR